MSLFRVQGIVLRTIKLGEADRIVVVCTKERGKVRGVAKGIRKTKSRFGGRLEPLAHVSLQCYEGRELDIVTQAETIETFGHIRQDLDRARRAMSLLEVVDQVCQEDEVNPSLYQMLAGALRTLDKQDAPLIVGSFYWKLLAHEGLRPMLDSCASCGKTGELVAFDLTQGGGLCSSCRTGRAVSPEAFELMRRVFGGDLARVLDEPASPVGYELEQLADEAMEIHLERRIRSRHMLDRT
jgi:DNA repair protein RecO (recombination protein O)